METNCKEEPRKILFESFEDQQIKTLLREMDDFVFKLKAFKENLEHYADSEEEEKIFSQVRELFDEAARDTLNHQTAKKSRNQPV